MAGSIGPAGGTVELADGARITIPEGALSQDVQIRVATLEQPPAALPATGVVHTLSDDEDRSWEVVDGAVRSSGAFTVPVTHISYFAELVASASITDASLVDASLADASDEEGPVRDAAPSVGDATVSVFFQRAADSTDRAYLHLRRRQCLRTDDDAPAPQYDASPPIAEALAVDANGNVYRSFALGIDVFSPSGALVKTLPGPPDQTRFTGPSPMGFDAAGNLSRARFPAAATTAHRGSARNLRKAPDVTNGQRRICQRRPVREKPVVREVRRALLALPCPEPRSGHGNWRCP